MATRKAGTAVEEHGQRARKRVTETRIEEDLDPERQQAAADRLAGHDPDGAAERDRSIMEGGPGQGADGQPAFAFSYKGKEFKTQEEVTSYIDELQQQRETQRQEPVREQRQEPARQEPAAKRRAGESIDFDKELYTDPKKVFGQFRDEIKAEIQQEMTDKYNADQTMREFWSSFYTENKDMKGKEILVDAVFQRALKDIGELPIGKAKEELASRVREAALQISGTRGRQDGSSSERNRTLVEAGSGPASRGGEGGRERTERVIPNSLSALIRSRQNARRAQPQT